MPASARVRVTILFGTGSEAYRHGLCGVVDVASQPTILIIVPGIEETYPITFNNPGGGESKKLVANNRWGIGITEESVRSIVAQHLGRDMGYDVVVCAAYSTGYLGFSGLINNRLISFQTLECAIVFDCLYKLLGQSLFALRQLKPSVNIVAYVVTGAGNDFDADPPSFQSLSCGNRSYIHYVNLFFNPNYYTAAAARVISEGIPPVGSPIITVLPPPFESALKEVTARLPPRGSMVSDPAVYKTVKGSVPSNSTTLASFSGANASQIMHFFFPISFRS